MAALRQAVSSGDVGHAAEAVRLTPANSEAHYVTSALLYKNGHKAEAYDELRLAASLRPLDYQIWLELGSRLEENGNYAEAIKTLNQAVLSAPFYAQPRWQLGNALLKAGRRDDAFSHLAVAGSSDPQLFLHVVSLAWKEFEGNPVAVQQAVHPQTAEERIRLARFFVWRGLPDIALNLFRGTMNVTADDQAELTADLLGGKWFAHAYQVRIRDRKGAHENGFGVIDESGFETAAGFNDEGFGWKFPRYPGAVSIAFDESNPGADKRSLRLDWHGNTDSSIPTLSQLVLVEPASHYRLQFSVRSDGLISGTPPFMGIVDASNNDASLNRTPPLTSEDNSWQNVTLEFTTNNNTQAVRIVLQRPKCQEPPCPIFGRTWLDKFVLEKI